MLTLGVTADDVLHRQTRLEIKVVTFSLSQAKIAAELREPTKAEGLSLGDRACLALALDLAMPVYTSDSRWAEINVGADVHLIR